MTASFYGGGRVNRDPETLSHLPVITKLVSAGSDSDTHTPDFQWPRLALTLLQPAEIINNLGTIKSGAELITN